MRIILFARETRSHNVINPPVNWHSSSDRVEKCRTNTQIWFEVRLLAELHCIHRIFCTFVRDDTIPMCKLKLDLAQKIVFSFIIRIMAWLTATYKSAAAPAKIVFRRAIENGLPTIRVALQKRLFYRERKPERHVNSLIFCFIFYLASEHRAKFEYTNLGKRRVS